MPNPNAKRQQKFRKTQKIKLDRIIDLIEASAKTLNEIREAMQLPKKRRNNNGT